VSPLEEFGANTYLYLGYSNVSSNTFCRDGYDLLSVDEFRCSPASLQQLICSSVFGQAAEGDLSVAFKARPSDLPLSVPRWLLDIDSAYETFEPDIVRFKADS